MTTIHRDHEVLYAEVELSIHKSLNYVFSRGHFVPVLSPLYKFYIIMVGGGGVVGGGGGVGGEREGQACNYERFVFVTLFSGWEIRPHYFPDEKYGPIDYKDKLMKNERLKRFDRFKDHNKRWDSLYR